MFLLLSITISVRLVKATFYDCDIREIILKMSLCLELSSYIRFFVPFSVLLLLDWKVTFLLCNAMDAIHE